MALKLARIAALLCLVACERAGSADGQSAFVQDSTPAVWLRRAVERPEIAPWMYLRAAGETADSSERARLYRRIDIGVARDRIPWAEAQAREHFNDLTGALRAYEALPAPISVFRLRAELAGVTPQRDSVRRDMLRFMNVSSDVELVRDAFGLFDKLFPNATAAEQLSIARSAAGAGAWARALAGFEHSGAISQLSPRDRFTYATSLERSNHDGRAAEVYVGIESPSALADAARYRGARALLASDADRARALLHQLAQGSDTTAAASLSLLADLASDDGDDATSRTLLLEVVHRFASTRFAGPARFNAALIALIRGDARTAEKELAVIAGPDSATGDIATGDIAAVYWRGRAQEVTGNMPGARASWRNVIVRDSTSYYAMLAAARLGTHNLHPSPVSPGYPRVAAVDSAVVRIGLLRQMGMVPEVQLENDRLFRDAPADRPRLLATAASFAGTDQAARAITLGRRALADFGPSPDVYRLVFPVSARETIIGQARAAGIDPVLVAALIRQESSFNPRATSSAGARGLMQLMPDVARGIAARAGIRPWSVEMLYDPSINVTLGVRHLAPLIRGQPNLPRVLAAYNAGGSRVTRWARRGGAEDPEMFTERIPFFETREYVKIVLRNRELYRVLYAW